MRPYEPRRRTSRRPPSAGCSPAATSTRLVVTMTTRRRSSSTPAHRLGRRRAATDLRMLALLRGAKRRGGVSAAACGGCESACPEGVPIADALRTRMYADDYGDGEALRAARVRCDSARARLACATCSHQGVRDRVPARPRHPGAHHARAPHDRGHSRIERAIRAQRAAREQSSNEPAAGERRSNEPAEGERNRGTWR